MLSTSAIPFVAGLEVGSGEASSACEQAVRINRKMTKGTKRMSLFIDAPVKIIE
jgi:hypothetical protein